MVKRMSGKKSPKKKAIEAASLKSLLLQIREKDPQARVVVDLPQNAVIKAFDAGDVRIDDDGELSFDVNRLIEIADEIEQNKS